MKRQSALFVCAIIGYAPWSAAEAGQDAAGKLCILASAIKLPIVPGLEITASRSEPSKKPHFFEVTIEFSVAKQRFKTKYECLNTPGGAVSKQLSQPE